MHLLIYHLEVIVVHQGLVTTHGDDSCCHPSLLTYAATRSLYQCCHTIAIHQCCHTIAIHQCCHTIAIHDYRAPLCSAIVATTAMWSEGYTVASAGDGVLAARWHSVTVMPSSTQT